jgi:hypothetical protein
LITRAAAEYVSAAAFVASGIEMTVFDDDRDLPRLISAFKEIKSPSTRRAVVMLVEELAQKGAPPGKPSEKRG